MSNGAKVINLAAWRSNKPAGTKPRSISKHAPDCPYCNLLNKHPGLDITSHILLGAADKGTKKIMCNTAFPFEDLQSLFEALNDMTNKVLRVAKQNEIELK